MRLLRETARNSSHQDQVDAAVQVSTDYFMLQGSTAFFSTHFFCILLLILSFVFRPCRKLWTPMRKTCYGSKPALMFCPRLALKWRFRGKEQLWPNSQLTCVHCFLHYIRYILGNYCISIKESSVLILQFRIDFRLIFIYSGIKREQLCSSMKS